MPDGKEGPANAAKMSELEERLRARLGALERETETLRSRGRFFGFALLVTLALLAIVAVYPDVLAVAGIRSAQESLRVRSLVIVDDEQRPRGQWAVDDEGNVRISLLDRQARPRLNLTVLDAGFPGLSLANAEGQRRAVLGLLPDETTSLVFADVAGVPRAVVGLTQGDAANLVFADANGVTRVGMGLDGNGVGSVILPEETPEPDRGSSGSEGGS